MKPVTEYSSENVALLKQWLKVMADQGYIKYFEILVDGFRVIHKTSNLAEFEQHRRWMDETAQSMRVLVYNTKNSHRSRVFEFRTEKYVEGLSDKLYPTRKRRLNEDEVNRRVQQTMEQRQKEQQFADLEKQNRVLTKRINDAEDYIRQLEEKLDDTKDENSEFNLGSMLKMASTMASKNPELKKQLDDFGIGNLVNDTETKTTTNENEEPKATFKRKSSNSPMDSNPSEQEPLAERDDEIRITVPNSKLTDEMGFKLYDVVYFLSQNPAYLNEVYDLIKGEEQKQTG